MQRRKVTFRLYPNVSQQERLDGWVRLHAELYNAALQERIEAYRKAGISISYYDQQNTLPVIKQFRPELVELGSHALQETLRRLDRAFQAFFGVWGATEQKVHLSPAPARKPLWRLVSSGKPRFCRTLSRNGSVR
ncbi:TPA: transposase [Pseudomonas aeruginosa]|nr:transposase [Pseudomonas aeruginosa]